VKKCNFKDADLLAYCYGELNQERLQEIKDHLSACESCFSKVRGFEKTLELVKEQKLRKVPEGILSNYTQEVHDKISKGEEKVLVKPLKERGLDLVEGFRSIFSPKLIPVFVTVSIVIFAFIFTQQSKLGSVNLIAQEVALLEEIGENIEGIFLESDEEGIYQAIDDSDEIILAQAVDEAEVKSILDDLELIQELGEEVDINGLIEELNALDELDIELI